MENADSPLSLPCKDLHGNVYPDNLYLSLLCLFPLFPYISLNKHIIGRDTPCFYYSLFGLVDVK